MTNRFFLLDRDGILNEDIGYIFEPEKIIIPESIINVLLCLREMGFRFLVITNQSGIARGYFMKHELDIFHYHLEMMYRQYGIILEDFFYCPHLPQITGECLCRKPKSLLIEKAVSKYEINIQQSYMIGDNPRDVQAGKAAGLNTILISSESDTRADYTYQNLTSFYKDIKNCIL
jgi:D-glycero-D-manno-heptose 1,7-bisphosphate phosphatase